MHKRILLAAFVAAAAVVCPAHATVNSPNNTFTYVGNGATTTYTVPFKFLQNADLVVTVAGVTKTLGSDFTLSGAGNPTGTITFTTAPANSASIVITRTVDYLQGTSLKAQRSYDASIVEGAIDKIAMGQQQLQALYTNPPATVLPANTVAKLNNIRFADQFANIQAAITDAGTTGAVLIPSSYVASDTFTNPNSIPIIDLRGGPGSIRGAVSVRDFGAKGDWNVGAHTGTNDTAAVAAARAYAYTNQRALYFPKSSGCYAIDNTALDYGTTVSNNAKVTIFGDGQDMSCIAAVSTGQTLLHLKTASDWSQGIEISRVSFNGFSSSDAGVAHGIFMESATAAGPSHVTLQNVFVRGFSGHCVYLPQQWHTLLEDVSADDCKDNLFDLGGGNTTVLVRTYAMGVWPGRAGYRIHGSAVLIAVNGINNAYGAGNIYRGDQADWGVFGDESLTAWAPTTAYSVGDLRKNAGEEYECITAGTSAGSGGPTTIIKDITDGTAHWRHIGGADAASAKYAKMVLIGSNVESATRHGIRLKANSSVDVLGGNILPPPAAPAGAAGLIGIWAEFIDPQQMPMLIDGMPFANEPQNLYEHGSAIHITTGSSSLVRFGGTSNAPGIWHRTAQLPYTQPTITVATNGSTGISVYNAISVNRLFVNGGPLTLTRVTPTYGTSVTINVNLGNLFDVTVTNGTAFTVATPGDVGCSGCGVAAGMRITIRIINGSGGAMGAITWPASFKMSTWTNPANTFNRAITMQSDGTNWYQVDPAGVDIPN